MTGKAPLSASMMAKDKIRPAAVKVGIRLELGQRFGFHNFRHSLATFLISRGKDVKTIQELLRHAKASATLDLYLQAMDESKLAAQRDITLAITAAKPCPHSCSKEPGQTFRWMPRKNGSSLFPMRIFC
jgi:integrase